VLVGFRREDDALGDQLLHDLEGETLAYLHVGSLGAVPTYTRERLAAWPTRRSVVFDRR